MTRFPILIYHTIEHRNQAHKYETDPIYSVEEDTFVNQMKYLYGGGFNALSLDKYVELHYYRALDSESNDCLIEKPIIITFDDGHISNYTHGFPLLREYGFAATFFVTVKNIGLPYGMTWQQLREMADSGMSIQSHTMSHPFLSDLDAEQMRWELAESKSMLEDKLGRPVNYLSLPGGRNSSIVRRIAKEIGYQAICTSKVGSNTLTSDLYSLNRWPIKRDTTLSTFGSIANMKRSIAAYYRAEYFLLGSLKKILGNERYVAIRERFL